MQERSRESDWIIQPVTKQKFLKYIDKNRKLEQLTTEVPVLRMTNGLQCGFCSLAPPKIIVVFGLEFYPNLRHDFHWSSWRTG